MPFKIFSKKPLPKGVKITQKDGEKGIHVRVGSRNTFCKLTQDGEHYLHPSDSWYFKIDGN
jgi:hypothetical protein